MSEKTHVSIGGCGHVDAGKTSMLSAISMIQNHRMGRGEVKSYAEIDNSPEERERGITINCSHVQYESDKRIYAHVDMPGHRDFIKQMIAGASQTDGVILVIDGTQGSQEQTLEHVLLVKQVGVKHVVVFINKCDVADEELLELIEIEASELLEKHGYKDPKFVRGSALKALEDAAAGNWDSEWVMGLSKLIDVADEFIPEPERDFTAPFMMPIEDVFSIQGRGTVVTGKVERGCVKVGDSVEIVGLSNEGDEARNVVVTGTQAFHQDVPEARAGMNVGILLRGVKRDEVVRGQIITVPGAIKSHKKGTAEFYALDSKEGGRHKPFSVGYRPQFFFGTTDVTGSITSLEGVDQVNPGDHVTLNFELYRAVGFEVGVRFAVREGSRTVGAGVVTAVE